MRKVIVFALGSLSVASLASAAILIGCTEDTTVTSLDAGKDATVSETGTPDGASDAGSDVFTTDAPVPTIDSFRSQVADAICDLYAGCCNALDAGSDAGPAFYARRPEVDQNHARIAAALQKRQG